VAYTGSPAIQKYYRINTCAAENMVIDREATKDLVDGRHCGETKATKSGSWITWNASSLARNRRTTHAIVVVSGRVESPVRHLLRGAGRTEKCESLARVERERQHTLGSARKSRAVGKLAYRDKDEELRAAVERCRDEVVVLAEPGGAVPTEVELREEREEHRSEDRTVDADGQVTYSARAEAVLANEEAPQKGRGERQRTEAPARDRADEGVQAQLREELVADPEGNTVSAGKGAS
jgi:hypothetical protein